MPLINIIHGFHGERVPHAPLNVAVPVVRVPLWVSVSWWLLRGLGRLAVAYVRFWPVTAPLSMLVAVYVAYGWVGLVVLVVAVAGVTGAWWFGHRRSCERWLWWPVLSRVRRWQYARVWQAAMVTAGLSVTYGGHTVVPVLKRVRARGGVDVLTVRLVSGQIPDDFGRVAERLTATFGARSVRVVPVRSELVTLVVFRSDPLARVVDALPVPQRPNPAGLPVAVAEDGRVWSLRLAGTHVLVAGATGAGKGSVLWSVVRALAGGVSAGVVELWGIDPKGGVELGLGGPLFARLAYRDYEQMVELLEAAEAETKARADRLRGHGRQLKPTTDEPLILVVIDELANLTAYLGDKKLRERAQKALGVVLTQGRAVCVHVLALLQDPRKEVLSLRGLFPTRVALRLSEPAEVDMVLGEGARGRGALADRIPLSSPGVGYVAVEGSGVPMRVRFSYVSDEDIAQMVRDYAPVQRPHLRVIDGRAAEGRAA